MTDTKTLRVPAQLRKHVIREVKPRTQGERELMAACKAGAAELERQGLNNMNSIDLDLTNEALGVALKLARRWLDSDNGNNVMAAKSMLKYELEYTPDDPREIRHEVKLPKSLAGCFDAPYTSEFKTSKRIPKAVKDDMQGMSWQSNGTTGRVRNVALGWFLEKANYFAGMHPTPTVQRAAKKFVSTYTEPYERTQRLINGYLGTGEDEEQAPEVEPAAVEETQRKRLVVIACGGKKSDAPGKIPADERYTGNYFRACLMAAEVLDGPTMILSAKYGLIPLTEEIENYDVTWGGKGSIRLGVVREQVEALGLEDAKVTVLGGERYVKAARQLWPDAEAPLKGGIGQQLKQLAGIYEGEALEDDEHPERAYQGKLSEVGYLPHRNTPKPRVLWFGGKAGKTNPEPGQWVKAEVIYIGEGQYAINRLGTTDELMTATLRTQIHWAPVGSALRGMAELIEENEGQEPAEVEETSPSPSMAPAPPMRPLCFEVPANFLELAEEGDTEAARAYWTRRCEEYRKTGK
ncbi:hypothetical protein GTY75_05190 [Streptomyces sp. SID8381]|uniref:DUF6884 domain-containing protein n=1 Tax=unclassified Streptomyces TaxID=2593676 RepID=UPI00036EA254|nr:MULTISPECIES: DUF6884 domain-containing protein [unclassified Streptomyces]MYX26068.1 hypothetical protein [Streptomyces sp. SID8381]